MASKVDEIFRMLKDTTGIGDSVTVLNDDTVAPRHSSGPPSGFTETSVAVITATGCGTWRINCFTELDRSFEVSLALSNSVDLEAAVCWAFEYPGAGETPLNLGSPPSC